MGLIATLSLEDIFQNIESEKSSNDETPLLISDDPLALSWASYGVWKKGGPRWLDLASVKAGDHDRDMAQATRAYYKGSLTLQGLQGKSISNFRQDLYAVLLEQRPFLHKDLGMVYRLPYFYEEDQRREWLREHHWDQHRVDRASTSVLPDRKTAILHYLTKIFVGRCRHEVDEYWFDSDDGLCQLIVVSNNPIKSFMISAIEKYQDTGLEIEATWCPRVDRSGMPYHQIRDVRLV